MLSRRQNCLPPSGLVALVPRTCIQQVFVQCLATSLGSERTCEPDLNVDAQQHFMKRTHDRQ